jgi:hypothetical protein
MEFLYHRLADLGRRRRAQALMHPVVTAFRPARTDWAQASLVASLLFALYAATAPRTVAMEDDGLFVLASYYLGVAHPPGYPLFTLLGKLFTVLPFGSVAYRVHLLSALFGALTCGMLWLCARTLVAGRLPAYLSAFALGLSPAFWSQAIIAEVYTLNTFFFVLLAFLVVRAAPLPWIAFLFGLSLTNHWPLMLLVAPAFGVLLWPRRLEILRRLPLLAGLAALGLLPYVWMVVNSWRWLPISYDGPLESLAEVWYVIRRAGYAHVDQSASANWLDRIKFFRFLGAQLLIQFALLGTLLAAAGFAVQRRFFGGRVALGLSVAFLMPTVVLLLLLGFDYDTVSKHTFHVYPLPAYAVMALWIGLGFAWLRQRYRVGRPHAITAGVAVLALVMGVGSGFNLLASHDWGARYAQTVLRSLPKDGVLFVQGDVDLGPVAYFYLIEGWRPDVEIYHSGAKVLGNRLFHPLRTTEEAAQRTLRQFVEEKQAPIAFTMESYGAYAHRDRWLYREIDKSVPYADRVAIDIPEVAVRFFEESIASTHEPNAWVAYHQDELRRRYAVLLGQRMPHGEAPDARTSAHLAVLSRDFYGALGLAEGLMANNQRYSAGTVADLLGRAARVMPPDATKAHKARFLYLRGALRLDLGDKAGATSDFEAALEIWPSAENLAAKPLKDLLRSQRNEP